MKANYRRFKQSSKAYSRSSSKGDLHRALWEEDVEIPDAASSGDAKSSPGLGDAEVDRVVLTRGGLGAEHDDRFAGLRAWQEQRAGSDWQHVDEVASAPGGWLARIWRRLLRR